MRPPSAGLTDEETVEQPNDGTPVATGESRIPATLGPTDETPLDRLAPTDVLQSELWDDPGLAAALASRDIGQLFRFLQQHGVSQRHIAAATGQSQSEISEIVHGRTVTAYPVLERIALGLRIPRGRLGLAYDEDKRVTSVLADQRSSHETVAPLTLTADEGGKAQGTCAACGHPGGAIDRDATVQGMPGAGQGEPLNTLLVWSGLEAKALRVATRMSVREFAEYIGIAPRMVSKWEAAGMSLKPRPVNQAALDTCLDRLDEQTRERFTGILKAANSADATMKHSPSQGTPSREHTQPTSPDTSQLEQTPRVPVEQQFEHGAKDTASHGLGRGNSFDEETH